MKLSQAESATRRHPKTHTDRGPAMELCGVSLCDETELGHFHDPTGRTIRKTDEHLRKVRACDEHANSPYAVRVIHSVFWGAR